MTIYHFIPKAEVGIHTESDDCKCEPQLIGSDRLDGCNWAGETVYEHYPFGPAEIQDSEPADDGTGGSWVTYESFPPLV